MYHSIGTNTLRTEIQGGQVGPRYKVFAIIGKRDISKYTDSRAEAERILKIFKESAGILGIMDMFRGEIHEVN